MFYIVDVRDPKGDVFDQIELHVEFYFTKPSPDEDPEIHITSLNYEGERINSWRAGNLANRIADGIILQLLDDPDFIAEALQEWHQSRL